MNPTGRPGALLRAPWGERDIKQNASLNLLHETGRRFRLMPRVIFGCCVVNSTEGRLCSRRPGCPIAAVSWTNRPRTSPTCRIHEGVSPGARPSKIAGRPSFSPFRSRTPSLQDPFPMGPRRSGEPALGSGISAVNHSHPLPTNKTVELPFTNGIDSCRSSGRVLPY